MTRVASPQRALVDWSIASRPLAGQTVSGDVHLVQSFEHGVLLAVIDGMGHGDEAAAAAQIAATILTEHAGEPVIPLVKRCHQALAETRGVEMTMALVDALEDTVTWLGVGNVEGRLLRGNGEAQPASESALLRNGVIGYRLPALHASVLDVAPGDLVLFATDGIHPGFIADLNPRAPTVAIATQILNRHFKGTDDALVLVARYIGGRHE